MTFKEIEALVSCGESMGQYAPIHALSCWHALRSLYADYRRGVVDAEVATREKRRIHGAYDWACTQDSTTKQLCASWSNHIKVSQEFRAQLLKGVESGEGIQSLFYIACTCIAAMTGDATLAGSAVKQRMEQAHQIRLDEVKKT